MRIVVLHSGGIDSTVLLRSYQERGNEPLALSFSYGQRHWKEIGSAAELCGELGIEHRVADLTSSKWLLGGSSITSYKHVCELAGRATVVPNRNMLFLSYAIAWAVQSEASAVAFGAHACDSEFYPDCREAFVSAMDGAAGLCSHSPIRVLAPFTGYLKSDIIRLGESLGVPWGKTWSCYAGGEQHCGMCGSCKERKAAFKLAGVDDPTQYLPGATL